MWWWHMPGGCGWLGGIGGLFSAVLLAALVGAAVFLVIRALGSSGRAPAAGPDALAILRVRYARGEISHEEFERMRKELSA